MLYRLLAALGGGYLPIARGPGGRPGPSEYMGCHRSGWAEGVVGLPMPSDAGQVPSDIVNLSDNSMFPWFCSLGGMMELHPARASYASTDSSRTRPAQLRRQTSFFIKTLTSGRWNSGEHYYLNLWNPRKLG